MVWVVRVSLPLGARRAVTVVPSRLVSTSARNTEPTPDPSGTRVDSTVPRGCLAPTARHVHVDGSVWLVSSTSMRWAIPGDRLLLWPPGADETRVDGGVVGRCPG